MFLTTHYLEEAEQADRICIISHGKVVSIGAPEDVKADLVHDYVLIDAEDRVALLDELTARGIEFSEERRVKLDIRPSQVHGVLRSIETPLSLVRTHTPSLEDAYMEIVEIPAEQEAMAEAEAQLWGDEPEVSS